MICPALVGDIVVFFATGEGQTTPPQVGRLLSPTDFEVVLLRGTGDRPNENTDIEIVRTALRKLGWEGVVQAVLRGT